MAPAARTAHGAAPCRRCIPSILIIACGALAREITALRRANSGRTWTSSACRPSCTTVPNASSPPSASSCATSALNYETIFVAYADCGTGGMLDALLREEGVERLPGAHCYEFFAGSAVFAAAAGCRARHVLSDRLPAAPFRSSGHPRAGARPASGAGAANTSATTASWSISRRIRRPKREHRRARSPQRMGFEFEYRFTGYGELGTRLAALLPQRSQWPH